MEGDSVMTGERKIALIGSKGMLAGMVARMVPMEYQIVAFDIPEFDVTDRNRVIHQLSAVKPDIILNCAAMTDVDGCEGRPEEAMRVNGEGPGFLAEAARRIGAVLVHISTDFVFDGAKSSPYLEEDETRPLSVYGASKRLGEKRIIESGLEEVFIVRTSWLYGPGGKNFVETICRLAAEREELRIVDDQRGAPTYTRDLARAVFALLETRSFGLYHFSNAGECSWHEFAIAIVSELRKSGEAVAVKRILPIPTEAYPLPAERPKYSVLSKEKIMAVTGIAAPDWRSSLSDYFSERKR